MRQARHGPITTATQPRVHFGTTPDTHSAHEHERDHHGRGKSAAREWCLGSPRRDQACHTASSSPDPVRRRGNGGGRAQATVRPVIPSHRPPNTGETTVAGSNCSLGFWTAHSQPIAYNQAGVGSADGLKCRLCALGLVLVRMDFKSLRGVVVWCWVTTTRSWSIGAATVV